MNEGEDGSTRTAWRTLLCRWRLTSHNAESGQSQHRQLPAHVDCIWLFSARQYHFPVTGRLRASKAFALGYLAIS
jgi:hypothetical protein